MQEQVRQRAAERTQPTDPPTYNTRFSGTGANEDPTQFFASAVLMGVGGLVTLFAAIVGNALCQAALIKNISELYLGHDATVGQSYRYVVPKLLTLVGAGLLVTLAISGGYLLLIVPGVIFTLWLALTPSSIVVENQGVIQAMSRSKNLVAGNLGKVFCVAFLAWIISAVIGGILGFGLALPATLISLGNSTVAAFVNQFAGVLGHILSAPISAAAYVLLYYDLRIRKEGFDLQMLAQSVGSNQG
jgi:hypothetical protein